MAHHAQVSIDVNSTYKAVEALLRPQSIAFVGASEDPRKVASRAYLNVVHSSYPGQVFAVNTRRPLIEGRPSYGSVDELPEPVDVGFVTVPAAAVPNAVRALGQSGAKVAVVAVGGFIELGTAAGRELQEELVAVAQETGIRIVGPVCNGVYNTALPLPLGYNSIHARELVRGGIALVSHSGALVAPLVAAIESFGVGLSHFVSAGNEADLGVVDFLEFLVTDDATSVIALVVDRVDNGERFISLLGRARQSGRPVVILKLGNSDVGRRATLAHSGRLAGSRYVYDAVLQAEGALRVPTLETLAAVSAILARGKRPRSPGVVACSTSGGGAIALADLLTESGASVAELAPSTVAEMASHMQFETTTIMNPFDLGLGGWDNYPANIRCLAADPGTGVLLNWGTPIAFPHLRRRRGESFAAAARDHPELPIVMLFPGLQDADEREIYQQAGIPVVESTLDAVAIAKALTDLARDKDASGATAPSGLAQGDVSESAPSGPWAEYESRALVRRHGLHTLPEFLVPDVQTALGRAIDIGYPVVLKANGRDFVHKSDEGLVRVGIRSAEELQDAWDDLVSKVGVGRQTPDGMLLMKMAPPGAEVIVGVSRDPEFGPIAVIGPGGTWAEIFGPAVMARAPLPVSEAVVRRMVAQPPLSKLLAGGRGSRRRDVDSLVSQAMSIFRAARTLGRRLEALEVNPMVVLEEGAGAWPLDTLIVLNDDHRRNDQPSNAKDDAL